MAETSSQEITRLLHACKAGDPAAHEKLWEVVYPRLSRLAGSYLVQEREGHTLETGALVNEAFLRLIDQKRVRWQDRAHFFALSAKMMRRVLVDHARRTESSKRDGDQLTIRLQDLNDPKNLAAGEPPDLVHLDDALLDLESEDPELARLVVMRYFGGMTRDEIAEVLAISTTTVARQWRTARAWLFAYLAEA